MKNGLHITRPGRGSVCDYAFGVIRTRRVLLHARMPDGQYSPKGEAVLDSAGNYISTVGSEGSIFVGNGQLKGALYVRSENGAACTLDFRMPEKPPADVLYEEYDAVCRPGAIPPVVDAPANETRQG
ncbi:FimD/PapC C-terminal domain-containing protein [Cupriavidus lacunae]|uniref:FimD/PapC C-terminal domain-containing protein n=1 Tax=Cupriavidus lacunae TaxID=2666307 RepID=UPI002448172C|nr:FimD/PapC C-terminal domain-containing protein [Cupriavidus lacunae]